MGWEDKRIEGKLRWFRIEGKVNDIVKVYVRGSYYG